MRVRARSVGIGLPCTPHLVERERERQRERERETVAVAADPGQYSLAGCRTVPASYICMVCFPAKAEKLFVKLLQSVSESVPARSHVPSCSSCDKCSSFNKCQVLSIFIGGVLGFDFSSWRQRQMQELQPKLQQMQEYLGYGSGKLADETGRRSPLSQCRLRGWSTAL